MTGDGPAVSHRIESLDSLRGIAALVVVANHCLLTIPEMGNIGNPALIDDPSWFHLILRDSPLRALYNGPGAVMLFFVLSGIALSLALSGPRADHYGVFVLRRICRIYLPYVTALAVAATLCVGLAPYRPSGLSEWFKDYNWSEPLGWSSIADYGLMLGQHTTVDNVIWSLDYEMRISLIFPLLLWAASGRRYWGPLSVGAVLLLASWPLLDVPAIGPALAGVARYATAFLLGTIISQAIPWLRNRRHQRLPLALVVVGALGMCIRSEYVETLSAAAILIAAILPGPVDRFCLHPSLLFLGRISYSLYLVHLPTLLTLLYLFYDVLGLPAVLLAAVPVSIGTAWVFHTLVEAPCRRLGSLLARKLRSPRSVALGQSAA